MNKSVITLVLRSAAIYLASILFLTPVVVFAKKDKGAQDIPWSQNKIIDGLNNDWDAIYQFSDDKARIQYAFANDSDDLYISLKTGDPIVQMKLLSGGLVTWIDTNGKKDPEIGLAFPQPSEGREETTLPKNSKSNDYAPGNRPNSEMSDMINRRVSKAQNFVATGFARCKGRFSIKEQNDCDIEVGLLYNELGELIYEARIPLSLFNRPISGPPFSIGFEIPELQKPKFPDKTRMDGPQGMERPGRSGPPPGGMSGGMGGPPPGRGSGRGDFEQPNTKIFDATSTWTKVRLAAKPPQELR